MSDELETPAAETKYQRVVQAIAETPWALLPSTLAAITDLIAFRADGHRLTEDEIRARIGAGPARKSPYATSTAGEQQARAVAVVPLYGVVSPRMSLMAAISGGTSLADFQSAFTAAVNDPGVSAVLLDVDSPGGSVALVPETAALIRSARGSKPIVAIANTLAASAAYWLACQADELVVSPSAEVGSIGVYMAHQDRSAMQEKLGVKTTLISAGPYKTEGNPFEPLTDDARQALQSSVDEMYGLFVNDVAAGRGVTTAAVRNGFAQGRVVGARQALELGMADRVDSFDATVTRLLQDTPAPPPGRNGAAADDPDLQAAAPSPEAAPADEHDQDAGELAAITGLLRQTHQTLSERTADQ